ncbi:MAG: tRNA uridine-5-carboxymethylaminomethyl(34) synthesis GTPase MnmE [Bacteroidota bacterium]|nr:tRNA uridine-5-carboxymethylaminomethyl(34) synthesis GTPase MnmE [Bacteroidota bacterium]
MSLATLHDTIYALSTPPGKSAIAVMRITGRDAIKISSKCISDPERLFSTRGGDSIYTNITDENGNHVDDVIITVFRAPHSYTGEDLIEIHTHGSVLIVDLLQNLLQSSGARLAEPGEFSRRAYMHGKITLEELEVLTLRIDASSERALSKVESLVARKYEKLRNIYDVLIGLLAQVNAQIDFGESDHVQIEGLEDQIKVARTSLQEYIDQASSRSANKGYYSVALVGPPNVGKSSLFNSLLRYERSIVSEVPGTTRDYLEAYLIIDGFRVKLIDTAGLREAQEEIESKGIALGKSVTEESDLTLRITDPESRDVIPQNGEILVHNKADLDHFQKKIFVSAKTGEGLQELTNFLKEKLVSLDSQFSSYSVSDSERSLIKEVLRILENVAEFDDVTLLAENIRRSSEILASLLGQNIGEDSLNHIFLKMCIGK